LLVANPDPLICVQDVGRRLCLSQFSGGVPQSGQKFKKKKKKKKKKGGIWKIKVLYKNERINIKYYTKEV